MSDLLASTDYHPHARQEAFHRDPHPRRWFMAGYGTGKTSATVWEAFINAVVHHPGYTGIVCAPTFPLLWQGWIKEWKHLIPSSLYRIREGNNACMWVTGPGGQVSEVLLRSSAHASSLEAVNAGWAVFDEASREQSPEPYRVLLGRLRRGNPGHQRGIVLTGPPMTRRHWTAVEFGAGVDPTHTGDALSWHDDKQAVIRARTRDNPHLPPTYERDIRSRPGATLAWCRQWLDAEVGSVEGQIYPAFSRDVHVVPASSLVDRKWRRTIVGVDWGFTHPGVMLPLSQDGMGDVYLTAEEVHTQKSVTDDADGWVPIARSLDRAHSPEGFACDPSMPGNLKAIKKGVRARVYGANNDVGEGIRVVTAMLEEAVRRHRERSAGRPVKHLAPALYVSDRCHHTIGELESYARKKLRDGSISEEPTDVGDDAMDALRYAAVTLAGRAA